MASVTHKAAAEGRVRLILRRLQGGPHTLIVTFELSGRPEVDGPLMAELAPAAARWVMAQAANGADNGENATEAQELIYERGTVEE
jgi:hypothetical protein